MGASLREVAGACDRLLRPDRFDDWAQAFNGLQVENRGRVTRLAAAVDAREATIGSAIEAGADLLLVHHGLFWSPGQPWTGPRYRVFGRLWEHNLAIYSSHLPLDAHPRVGNNAQLCRALGLKASQPFLKLHGGTIGWKSRARLARSELAERLARAVGGPCRVVPCGPAVCRWIGVVSGGAGDELRVAAEEGVDTFVTGEGPHWTYGVAEELGINVLYGGHYATETFGVRALAAWLGRRFRLPWAFLDLPTGL
ncbi:MAG TPA: Nif3-like dinuclear metal center hexameric protein [Candidatus Paceibacterota bacterium]|nr:Nif3-like dinuclear metal center hexameric protein [Verrucomicrobiota bacterium]HRZ43844.1 Nif3-like dinuclear metal center hexameric protein [Candidatus Paceibacterota bacterium]HRZ94431.1 Nif3-like dinuclear metal center hexameric protein [Candidatus Paceibacterota bacterium]